MNSYLLDVESNRWRIVHFDSGWFLKRHVVVNPAGISVMTPVGIFRSAEQAAEAVADGTTGEIDWDATERALPRQAYLLPAWKVVPPYDVRASPHDG